MSGSSCNDLFLQLLCMAVHVIISFYNFCVWQFMLLSLFTISVYGSSCNDIFFTISVYGISCNYLFFASISLLCFLFLLSVSIPMKGWRERMERKRENKRDDYMDCRTHQLYTLGLLDSPLFRAKISTVKKTTFFGPIEHFCCYKLL